MQNLNADYRQGHPDDGKPGLHGVGGYPSHVKLGALVTQGRRFILTSWWYSTVPGLFIFLIVFSFNTLGDTVRDMLDPGLRN